MFHDYHHTTPSCISQIKYVNGGLQSVLEFDFENCLFQMELEKSVVGDHELRLQEDAEKMSRKQAANYDSDEDDDPRHQETILAQDLEDSWELRLKNFQPAPRVRGQCSMEPCKGYIYYNRAERLSASYLNVYLNLHYCSSGKW